MNPETASGFPRDESQDTDLYVPPEPGAWIVERCRAGDASVIENAQDLLHCNAIIAVTEGRLAPGEYSDSELRSKLDE